MKAFIEPGIYTFISSVLSNSVHQNYSFAACRLPNSTEVEIFSGPSEYKTIQELDQKSFIIHPFIHSDQILTIEQLTSDVIPSNNELIWHKSKADLFPIQNTDYLYLVQKSIQFIQEGYAEKIVASKKNELEVSSIFSPVNLFRQLIDKYPNAFISLISTPEYGTWLGASPELLLKCKAREVETVSLAGTVRHSSKTKDFSFTTKDYREQEIVSEFIRDIFNTHCSNVSESELKVKQAGELMHLFSSFKATLQKGISVDQILSSLHPTPATCGFPVKVSMDFINRFEGFNRELFSGYIGIADSNENVDLYVNLRCMKLDTTKAVLYAGAGILADSNPNSELIEIENKFDTLRLVINT